MTSVLRHRGPDDEGWWLDPAAGVALGHRRLSILDLSPDGHQPMQSKDGRWVLVFNGEIYNFRHLRQELEARGVRFRGHSDTEVLVEAIACWGVRRAFERAAGMFAVAAWDRLEQRLYLVRDRFGEKPLYYGWLGRTLAFSSELKALRACPGWRGDIDRGALALYLRFNYVPAPYSIYDRVYKLLPAHIATVDLAGGVSLEPFWSLRDVVSRGLQAPLNGTDLDLVNVLESQLRCAIREQMVADVPVGALLSGGIDSTTVVALMQAESERPVRTFTVGFAEPGYNEAAHAARVARHLATDHTELYVTPAQARAVIPRLATIYDEPFGDCSQIPTLLICQLARRHVTVALSGDGGDELFGGYNRYFVGPALWTWLGPWPRLARRLAGSAIRRVSPSSWDAAGRVARVVLPRKLALPQLGDRLHKLAGVLGVASETELYRALCSHWDPPGVAGFGYEPPTLFGAGAHELARARFVERMMYEDARTYLPDDLFVKVDRAAMSVGLECRAPLVDHRVAELAWQLPLRVKIRGAEGKWVLRQIAFRHVPPALVQRPKQGFGVPIAGWLRDPLREWAEELLSPDRLRRDGFLRPDVVTRAWLEHLAGRRNWQYPLWGVLMLQAWLDALREPAVPATCPSAVA